MDILAIDNDYHYIHLAENDENPQLGHSKNPAENPWDLLGGTDSRRNGEARSSGSRRVAPPWIQYLGHGDLGVLHELGRFMICNSGESEKFAE